MQQGILSHPSTGGFLSHCGWNSTLESVINGVPMLAWPFQHDQPFVKKLLVEELGVAEEVKRETVGNGVFAVKSAEVERVVKLIIEGEKGRDMRKRTRELKISAMQAVEEGTPSALDWFAVDMDRDGYAAKWITTKLCRVSRGKDLTTDKSGTNPIKANIPNSYSGCSPPGKQSDGQRFYKAQESFIRFAASEDVPTKVEMFSWGIYGLCSHFAQAFLIPVLFPLLLGQTVKLSGNYERDWDDTFSKQKMLSIYNKTISEDRMTINVGKLQRRYEQLVHSSISIGNLKISPVLLTGSVWAITIAALTPSLPTLSPLLDYGKNQQIFLVLSSAIGIIACLPPGLFTNTWAVAAFLAVAIAGSSLSSMAYNRHLALMIRGASDPIHYSTETHYNSSISYIRENFARRQTADAKLSGAGTAAEGVGAAVVAAFAYKMLGFHSAARLGIWIACIFGGIVWAAGTAQAFFCQPVRRGPDFPEGKFFRRRGWIDAFSIGKFPHAVTSGVLVFLGSFAASCVFVSGLLYALGARCFEGKYVLFMLLAYFVAPTLSAAVMGLLQRVFLADNRQMQAIGFVFVAGVSALGFVQHSWRPWWAIVGAVVQGLGVGILRSYGRTLFLDFTPPNREGAFLVWFSIVEGAGLCSGFIVGCVRSSHIRMAFCSSLVATSAGLLLLIFGNVGNFGGFVNAGHVKERPFSHFMEKEDHATTIDNEKGLKEEVVELEPESKTQIRQACFRNHLKQGHDMANSAEGFGVVFMESKVYEGDRHERVLSFEDVPKSVQGLKNFKQVTCDEKIEQQRIFIKNYAMTDLLVEVVEDIFGTSVLVKWGAYPSVRKRWCLYRHAGVSTEVDPTNLQAMITRLDTNDHITFDHTAIPHNNPEHNFPLYLEVVVTRRKIKRVIVDGGSGLNIYTLKLVKQLGHSEIELGAKTITITAYDNEERESVGTIVVPMEVGPTCHDTTFHVLDLDLPYNMLLGCPWIHAMQAIPSIFHQCINGLLSEEKMLEDPTSRVPEGTMASCNQAPQYIKGPRMMFVMGYSGFGCGINAQGRLEPIPIPHFKTDKHGLGIRPHDALPSENDATSSECEDVSSHSDSDADSQCSLYEDLASMNLFPDSSVLTLSESIPLDKYPVALVYPELIDWDQ
ncbi:hypothetical protein KI387_025132 [Taxus chinensis]|uniref:Uncharacterized protein n=1 Tax=Taxus chinensis TaxID=29808 RepID=A0AA38LCA9_TAXCH|nr:hypothetical protein KI387_025132 [Taxus chinensis]